MRAFLLLPLLLAAAPLAARDCRFLGESINPDNASYYAGKSGRIKCYDEAGELISEEEVRDGEMIGYERRKDPWGNWSERTTNANGNTEGVAKEFWPDGTLKSEATYENGDLVGVARRFHKNGKLARLSHSAGAVLEYDAQGYLETLTCGEKSLLPEDAAPCGFQGRNANVDLFRNGVAAEKRIVRNGKTLWSGVLGEAPEFQETRSFEEGVDVRRSFHPNGQMASELRVVDGYHVEERTWYMNGRLKTHDSREPTEKNPKTVSRQYDDAGRPTLEETREAGKRTVKYFDAGTLLRIDDLTDDGVLERRRDYAADGSVKSDASYYPDGSRK